MWNMKMMVMPIVIGALGMVHKGLERGLKQLEIRGRIETIQTTALLKLVRNPGDPKRLAVTQTPVKTHQQTLA